MHNFKTPFAGGGHTSEKANGSKKLASKVCIKYSRKYICIIYARVLTLTFYGEEPV